MVPDMTTASPDVDSGSIDAIPTAPSAMKATVVAVAAIMAGGIGLAAWWLLPRGLAAVLPGQRGGDGEPGISNTGFTVFDWALVFGRGRAWHSP